MYTNDGHSKYQRARLQPQRQRPQERPRSPRSVTFANKKNISDDFSPDFPTGYPNDPADIEAEYGRARGDGALSRRAVSGIFHAPWGVDRRADLRVRLGPAVDAPSRLRLQRRRQELRPSRRRRPQHGERSEVPTVSLRLTKAIPVGGYGQLEAIAEAFNLTNFKNFDVQSIAGRRVPERPDASPTRRCRGAEPHFGILATLPRARSSWAAVGLLAVATACAGSEREICSWNVASRGWVVLGTSMDLNLKDKVVIVTGGAAGIGRATVDAIRGGRRAVVAWDVTADPKVDVTNREQVEARRR